MAKRKKTSGGGAFGRPRSAQPAPAPVTGFHDHPRGAEPMLKLIRRIAEAKNFESQEELGRFLNENIIGKTPEELAAMADELSPPTPEERADRLIDELPGEATDEHIMRTARQALAISPDCLGAWLMLGIHEPDNAKAMEHFEQGIQRGNERFRKKIESVDDDLDLWGEVAARDLIRLMIEKARLLENERDPEQAIAAYREILKLNPGDNNGVRGDLLLLLMAQRKIAEARALVDAYPNDADTAIAWGRAFVSIMEAIDRTGYEFPDDDISERFSSPEAFLKTLGPEFDRARKDVRKAAEINPFVPLFFTEAGLYEVETDDIATFGGPYEAIEYLKRWSILWHISGLPMLMLTTAVPKNLKKHIKGREMSEEMLDVVDQLENYDGPPWWQAIDDYDPEARKQD